MVAKSHTSNFLVITKSLSLVWMVANYFGMQMSLLQLNIFYFLPNVA
jgi:hypothetical protein